eukprot:482427-Pyramimonas_sp.AAC.1
MRGAGCLWVLGGDYNMSIDEIGNLGWHCSIDGVAAASRATTCRQSLPGTTIDWFMLAATPVPRVSRPPLNEEADARFHLPVILPLNVKGAAVPLRQMIEPKALPTEVKA